jgi:hypothetical protein
MVKKGRIIAAPQKKDNVMQADFFHTVRFQSSWRAIGKDCTCELPESRGCLRYNIIYTHFTSDFGVERLGTTWKLVRQSCDGGFN